MAFFLAGSESYILLATADDPSMVATGHTLAKTFSMGAVFGGMYAGMEVLVYKHVTDIMAVSGCQLAVDVGAMTYTMFYCLGNLLGGMLGGALAHGSHQAQMFSVVGVSGLCFVQALLMCFHHYISRTKQRKAAPQAADLPQQS